MANFRSKSKSKPSNKISASAANNRRGRQTPRSSGRLSASPKKGKRAAGGSVSAASKRSDTKQVKVIAMLRDQNGATVDAMMRSTGWQQHSVRGFLAAVVRKRLGLDLTSEAKDSGRVYRIPNHPHQKTADPA